MAQLLFTVADRFMIQGRGLVLVPGIAMPHPDPIKVGSPIVLKRPDGSSLSWTIGGLEMIESRTSFPPRRETPILLTGLGKEDVPVGTDVWSGDPA